MALPAYPANLPYLPLENQFKVLELMPAPSRTQVEDGPDILRDWSSSNWSKLQYALLYTHAEFDTFFTFYKTTLNRGRQRFTMPMGRLNTPLPWPSKTVYIDPGSLAGPEQHNQSHVVVSFVLNVNGW